MAITDKAVTIKGADAQVANLQIFPHPRTPGSVVIVVSGESRDNEGRPVALKPAEIVYKPGTNDLVSTLMLEGLNALRKANGLEDAPIALEPKADALQAQAAAK